MKLPPKMMPDAKISSDGWWTFTDPHGKSHLKFNDQKSQGILNHQYIDEESNWNIPMKVIPSGDDSEILITLNKPDELNNEQFDQRVSEMSDMVSVMKNIIESDG